MSGRYVLRSEDRLLAMPVEGVREGADGRFVIRVVRRLRNHPEYDPAEDEAIEAILGGFVAWLEPPEGEPTQVVRLSAPKGAELRDVGKWAIEYAPVARWGLGDEELAVEGVLTPGRA